MSEPPLPRLEHVANLHIDLASVIPGGQTPHGQTNWFEITGGTLDTVDSRLHAKILPGSGDYTTLHPEAGVVALDVHMIAQDTATNDIFRFQNKGFVQLDADIGKIFQGDQTMEPTQFGEKDVFESITCNTASKEYAWLNFATLVGQGRLVVKAGSFAGIEFRVFKLLAK